ncbi:MAG: glycosyltransferase, partial [Cytophagales bacterium]|nr:glycosyltransferase [Cytophagales bacterium]
MFDRNILLASVLKPCDDSRMFEKMGMSLAQVPGVTVHIIGHKVNRKSFTPNIIFHPIFSFSRTSFLRMLAPWKYAIQILKVKPTIVIVNTHELLIFTCLYKILFGAEIYYDIQENYFQNIAYTTTFPKSIRLPLAYIVRLKEWILAPLFKHFILAERCYANEIHFLKNRQYTIVENKFESALLSQWKGKKTEPLALKIAKGDRLNFIYSGTIAIEYGIFEAIEFMRNWVKVYPNSELYIIGFCPKVSTWDKVRKEIQGLEFVKMHGDSNELVPHQQILEALNRADVALLPYQPLRYTQHRVPTKMYECMALNLPMVIQTNPFWMTIYGPWKAGVSTDFTHADAKQVFNDLSNTPFYPTGTPQDIFWDTENEKLL